MITSKYFEANDATYIEFGTIHIENAGFLNLEEIILTYRPRFSEHALGHLEIFLGAQNLFTISGYTGGDPEVRYQNSNYSRNGKLEEGSFEALASGLSNENTYLHTQMWKFGFRLQFGR